MLVSTTHLSKTSSRESSPSSVLIVGLLIKICGILIGRLKALGEISAGFLLVAIRLRLAVSGVISDKGLRFDKWDEILKEKMKRVIKYADLTST